MSIINEPDRTQLYKKVRHLLGAPLRSVELEDEQMDTLLEFSIDELAVGRVISKLAPAVPVK